MTASSRGKVTLQQSVRGQDEPGDPKGLGVVRDNGHFYHHSWHIASAQNIESISK